MRRTRARRIGAEPMKLEELDAMSREERIDFMSKLLAVVMAAENVVAQWRGDISRKPHIGRLREALLALRSEQAKDE